MKREIKFRYWDTRFNKMFPFDPYLDAPVMAGDVPRCILMQFTGLYDRNGEEIYEGDIFNRRCDKAHPDGGYIAGTSAYHPENSRVVEFRGGAFMIGHQSLAEFWGFIVIPGHAQDRCGNIYENPELLK